MRDIGNFILGLSMFVVGCFVQLLILGLIIIAAVAVASWVLGWF